MRRVACPETSGRLAVRRDDVKRRTMYGTNSPSGGRMSQIQSGNVAAGFHSSTSRLCDLACEKTPPNLLPEPWVYIAPFATRSLVATCLSAAQLTGRTAAQPLSRDAVSGSAFFSTVPSVLLVGGGADASPRQWRDHADRHAATPCGRVSLGHRSLSSSSAYKLLHILLLLPKLCRPRRQLSTTADCHPMASWHGCRTNTQSAVHSAGTCLELRNQLLCAQVGKALPALSRSAAVRQ